MDLSKIGQVNITSRIKQIALLMLSMMLFGCAATTPSTVEPAQEAVQNELPTPEELSATEADKAEPEPEPEKTYLPLTDQMLYYILTAEIAGQRGEMGIAVDLYHRASELVDSPALASRSTQVATYSRDRQRINRALDRWLEVEPDSAEVNAMRIPFLLMNKKYEEAVTTVDKAVALNEEMAPTYLGRFSEGLTETTPPDKSLSLFKQLQSYQDQKPYAKYAYAKLSAYFQQYDIALAETEEVLKITPDNEDYLLLKVDLLQRMGRHEEALKAIEKTAKQKGASQNVMFSYAKMLGQNEQQDKAKAVFNTLYEQNPENRDVLFALGLLALDAKQPAEAKKYFGQIIKLGDPTHQAEYFMGLTEMDLGNDEAAMVWFASVPANSSRFEQAQSEYVDILMQSGQTDKALKHIAHLRTQYPNKANRFYLFEAEKLRELGRVEEAYQLLSEAISKAPVDNELRYSRAMLAESMGKIDLLEADLMNIINREPDNAMALNALGYTLTDRTDRHEEALVLIQKALEIKPDDPFYLDSLGWVYYRMGDLEKAEKYLKQAVKIQDDVEFLAHLGEVLWEQGKQDEAIKVWKQAKQQAPDNKLLLDTMKRYGQ